MSTQQQTTRSKTALGSIDADKGDAMEGIASTVTSQEASSSGNSYSFKSPDDGFEPVRSRAAKRKEVKIKKEQLFRSSNTRPQQPSKRQQQVFRLIHPHSETFIPYDASESSKKKTKISSTPTTVDPPAPKAVPIIIKDGPAPPTMNKGIPDPPSIIKQPTVMPSSIDQPISPEYGQDRPSTGPLIDQLPPDMEGDEYTPIVIGKLETWKAHCVIPEIEKSSQFCNYIIKIIKTRVDVIALINEKKIDKNTNKRNHVINVKVRSLDDLNILLALDFSLPAAQENGSKPTYKFEKVENVMLKRKQLVQERENRTIKVFNIPLQMENASLKAVFGRYGELEDDGITTRLKGIYRQALITYKEEASVNIFYAQWSVWAFKECLTVLPCLLSEEKKAERQQFAAKINGLPPNLCARDLQGLVSEVNGASIFIPRNPVSYKPMRYAFIYFKNEEDFNIATSNFYEFNGQQLEWSPLDVKSCHRYGYTGHIALFCEMDTRRPKRMNRNQLMQHFRDRNRRKFNSYADVTRNNRKNNRMNVSSQ